MFKTIAISLGRVQVGSEHIINYPYFDIDLITSIVSSCDCAKVTNDVGNKKIIINYKVKPIPPQVKTITMEIKKTATVEFFPKGLPNEKRIVVLSFNATVYE